MVTDEKQFIYKKEGSVKIRTLRYAALVLLGGVLPSLVVANIPSSDTNTDEWLLYRYERALSEMTPESRVYVESENPSCVFSDKTLYNREECAKLVEGLEEFIAVEKSMSAIG